MPDMGFPKLFRVNRYVPDSPMILNPRYSVHQTYTMDEGVAILVLWSAKHINLNDKHRTFWDAGRCQNDCCPMGAVGSFADMCQDCDEE